MYDEAHIGHARNYVCVDLARRVIEDVFQMRTRFVMNITDVDDKIILRGNLLFARQLLQSAAASSTAPSVIEAVARARAIIDEPKNEKVMDKLIEAQRLMLDAFAFAKVDPSLYPQAADFDAISRRFEREFLEDMDKLNVRRPWALTRVTEFIPEIVSYVERIIAQGFAYESKGSVYFDVKAFQAKHTYAKLQPNAIGDEELFAEGEGALSMELVSQKKSPMDFALWKASKKGEPAWASPWGEGRPGWHIECSAMASRILGEHIDIHSGGIDLLFPHHDNEIAQAEAHGDCDSWVNYWLHVGHLHIEGFKMSRSKKNFFSIREILQRHTPNQIRMFCCLSRFEAPVDYSDAAMANASDRERIFTEFFANVKVALRNAAKLIKEGSYVNEKYTEEDHTLHNLLATKQKQVLEAFRDNLCFPVAMDALQDLVRATNGYMARGPQSFKANLLVASASYVAHIFHVLGFTDNLDVESEIKFPTTSTHYADASAESGTVDREAVLAPLLDVLSAFRERVRSAAKEKKDVKEMLALCDDIRDNVLPELGIRLEDAQGSSSAWKLVDPAILKAERQKALEEAAAKQRAKEEAKAREIEKLREKMEKAKVHPKDMFRGETDKYSEFDEAGLPTKDEKGEPLSKSAIKKVQKSAADQQKLHEWYLEQIAKQSQQ